MDDLPPEIAELIERARREDEPSEVDQARVGRSLARSLGLVPVGWTAAEAGTEAAPSGAAASHAIGTASVGTGVKVMLVAVIVATGAGAAFMWRADPPAASSRSQRAVESSKGVAETAVAAADRSPNGSGDPQSTSAQPLLVGDATPDTAPNSSPTVRAGEQTRVVQARPSVDRSTVIRELRSKDSLSPTGSTAVPMKRTNLLEDELSLIQAASGALDAGDARDAMRTLEMHRRRFATGFLTEEREGLWIVALCQVGRMSEAAAARAEFERHAPRSPLRRRIETQCKAAAKALGDPSTSERPE